MQRHEAALIRYVVQHKLHLEDETFRARFLELLDLDEEHDADAIGAIEQFASDIACHVLERLIPADRFDGQMTNLEVAREFVRNAISYGEKIEVADWRVDTVMHNLKYIHAILAEPDEINTEYWSSDFK